MEVQTFTIVISALPYVMLEIKNADLPPGNPSAGPTSRRSPSPTASCLGSKDPRRSTRPYRTPWLARRLQ